jgi:cation transport protein ChaC
VTAPPPDAGEAPVQLQIGLTRDYLLSGGLADHIRRTSPETRLLTDSERRDSLDAILNTRREHGDGLWVFAYGSLIWNPAMHIVGQRIAIAQGWHRDFCLATKGGRGTPENPGMLLGLRPGGTCVGAVLRIEESAVEQELEILWRREMVADGYIPHWVEVTEQDGAPLGHAIAFTINPSGPSYCGELAREILIERIATARGPLGTAADYLFNTRDGLRALGINDPLLEQLGGEVEKLISTTD